MRLDANRLKTLTIIACKWNAVELDPNDAMLQIWGLFRKENLVTWNSPSFIQSLPTTAIKEGC